VADFLPVFLLFNLLEIKIMITIGGTLQTGTQSAQAVLQCELGDFSIWDERLKSIPPGEFEGLFEIRSIRLETLSSSRHIRQFGILADLRRFSFFDIEKDQKRAAEKEKERQKFSEWQVYSFVDKEVISESSIGDIKKNIAVEDSTSDSESTLPESLTESDDAFIEVTAPLQTELALVSGIKTDPETTTEITAADIALFGEHFGLSETIKLDTTEPREKLCQQRDRLKQLGYRFDAVQQIWQHPAH
jgi:Protein of unknown function (DUF3275)